MIATVETLAPKARPTGFDAADTLGARLRRIFHIYPGAVVVRAEPGTDPACCPLAFCQRRGIPPLLSYGDGEATEIAMAYPVYEAYVRHLARLAGCAPSESLSRSTVFWHDPHGFRGYRQMRIPAWPAAT